MSIDALFALVVLSWVVVYLTGYAVGRADRPWRRYR